ncbi:unnamed protein product [Darwinula stevensoni]|uniref:Phorbol-ester/DAG-type domain-containing protein n=1 Tax=Darwinula stevensoni TaxID=69355 RepID=A0A7R8X5Y2_9CRUS|nr:unnamed protein product [Darwinula stevensoni]CAG0887547.1 unnamed protein product [Darwinula stevensoni]
MCVLQRQGARLRCAACRIVVHESCVPHLLQKLQLECKPTFCDGGIRKYREQTVTRHHFVNRSRQKGKCKTCGKTVAAKLGFGSREAMSVSCSWCKSAYHAKASCFTPELQNEPCSLGQFLAPKS